MGNRPGQSQRSLHSINPGVSIRYPIILLLSPEINLYDWSIRSRGFKSCNIIGRFLHIPRGCKKSPILFGVVGLVLVGTSIPPCHVLIVLFVRQSPRVGSDCHYLKIVSTTTCMNCLLALTRVLVSHFALTMHSIDDVEAVTKVSSLRVGNRHRQSV